jgi:hypothetical protein
MGCPSYSRGTSRATDRASSIVQNTFNRALSNATIGIDAFNAAMAALGGDLGGLIPTFDTVEMDYNQYEPDTFGLLAPNTPSTPNLNVSLPVPPDISDLTIDDIGEFPNFSIESPTVALPEQPSADLPTAPDDPPSITDPIFPDPPAYVLPELPILQTVTIPDAPEYMNPTFTDEPPVDTIVALANTFSYQETRYTSDLLTAFRDLLLDGVNDGGTGISQAIQDQEYAYETERDRLQIQDTKDQIANDWASANWPLPDGVLAANLLVPELEYINKRLDKSRDIAIRSEERAYKWKEYVINQSSEIEGKLINYESDYANRALDAAKASIDASIAVFNAQVAKYAADIEVYKAKASVFETKIRAQR